MKKWMSSYNWKSKPLYVASTKESKHGKSQGGEKFKAPTVRYEVRFSGSN